MRLRLGFVALIAASVFAVAGTQPAAQAPATQGHPGRALTIEDYYRVQTVGGPQMSPNGRWVLFNVTTRVEETNGSRSETYYVPTDGSTKQRHLLHDNKEVTGASWTAESLLRYTANGQSFQIDLATPASSPIVATPAAASAAGGGAAGAGAGGGRGGRGGGRGGAGTASPDGKWTLQLRDKPQQRPTPPQLTDFEKRHEERFKGVQFDWMEFQRDGGQFPVPNTTILPAQQIVLQPSAAASGDAGTAPKVLFDEDLRPTSLVWNPNGQMFAFLADPVWRQETKYDRPDIFTATPDGKVTRVTDDGYVYSDLDFSPDGKFMSYARTFGTDMIISQKLNHGGSRDLFVRLAAGGEPVNLTATWDLEPGDSRWSPDGKFLYFTADTHGEAHLFRVAAPAATGATAAKVEQITKGPRRIGGFSYDKAFTKMAFTVGQLEAPSEIYVANIDGTGEKKLTDVQQATLEDIAFSKSERLTWKSKDGTEIEGWITYPYGYQGPQGPQGSQGPRYPLIVFSHGGPHAMVGYSFDFKKQFFAANGYFVLDTNFRSSTGYGDAFKWATWGAWGDKDGEDVIWGIDYAISRYPIDRARVGHTGHSYGGFMTNWLITQYPDRFAAAITGAGITNWVSDYGTADIFRTKETEFFGTPWDTEARNRMIRQSPLTYAGRVKTPTLFIHGEVDQRVPYEEGEQMYFALKRRGVPAKMIQYAGQPHGISGNWNNVHRMLNELRWWKQYLH